jgi:hypothetical protein
MRIVAAPGGNALAGARALLAQQAGPAVVPD